MTTGGSDWFDCLSGTIRTWTSVAVEACLSCIKRDINASFDKGSLADLGVLRCEAFFAKNRLGNWGIGLHIVLRRKEDDDTPMLIMDLLVIIIPGQRNSWVLVTNRVRFVDCFFGSMAAPTVQYRKERWMTIFLSFQYCE